MVQLEKTTRLEGKNNSTGGEKQLNWRGKTTQLEENNSTGGEQLNWRGKTTQLEGENNSTGGENNSTGGEKQLNSRGKATQLEGKTTQLEDVCLSSKKKSPLLGGPERKTSGVLFRFFGPAQVTIIKDSHGSLSKIGVKSTSSVTQKDWCKVE